MTKASDPYEGDLEAAHARLHALEQESLILVDDLNRRLGPAQAPHAVLQLVPPGS